MRRRAAVTLAAVALLGVAGCGGARTVKSNFAGDFNCDHRVEVEKIAGNRYRAAGCGTQAVYQCINHGPYGASTTCSLEMVEHGSDDVDSPASRPPPPAEDRAKVAKTKEGRSAIRLQLKLDDATLLKLLASPEKTEKVALRLMVRQPSGHVFTGAADPRDDNAKCQIEWLVNGQRTKGPPTKGAIEKNVAIYRTVLPASFVRELSAVRKLSLRACDRKWSLPSDQIAEIRRFFELYEEEAAWGKEARKGGTGGLVAPAGGWPDWSVIETTMPEAASGDPLDAKALFKRLARSVYQVEGLLSDGTAQGSAVAITQSELLTNCHVVQGAKKIILKHGDKEWVAKLERSDPKEDRCVLAVTDPILEPIAGVRTWDSLETGEPLYALGSPAGLELSLSNGILSGRREEDGLQFVQTTAPISPGSSGGGLFDARGNLVGITTLVFAGRERLNQALNFAIPAERFFGP